MSSTDVVVPDEVIAPDGSTKPDWDDPCPVCGNGWATGPERSRWGRQHCWKCGYAPGQTVMSALPGAPAQPDWAALVRDAVQQAMISEPQAMANAMTAALGREGLADLARQQQESLGMTPPAPAAPWPPATSSGTGSTDSGA